MDGLVTHTTADFSVMSVCSLNTDVVSSRKIEKPGSWTSVDAEKVDDDKLEELGKDDSDPVREGEGEK